MKWAIAIVVLASIFLLACTGAPQQAETQPKVFRFPFDTPPFWGEQCRAFAAERGYVCDFEEVPFPQLRDYYMTALLSGEYNFDVMHVYDGPVAEFGPKGLLLPVGDLLTDDVRADYPPGVIENVSVANTEGELIPYGVPLYVWMNNLYYRPSLLKAAGVEVPRTWDEMKETARVLTQGETYGLCLGMGGTSPVVHFSTILKSEGGQMLVDGHTAFNTEAGRKALGILVDMTKEGSLNPAGAEYVGSVPAIDMFTQGDCALFVGSPPTGVMAENPEKSKIVGDWAIALMPGGSVYRSATYSETGSRAIPFTAKYPDIAREFIQYVIRPDQMKAMSLTLGRIPMRISVLNDPEVQAEYPLARVVAKQFAAGPSGMPLIHERGTEIMVAMSNHIVAALRGEVTVDEALDQAEVEVTEILIR